MVTKYCKICGKEFLGYTNARYCSGACRIEFQTDYARRWRNKNREHCREYHRNYWRLVNGKQNKVQESEN